MVFGSFFLKLVYFSTGTMSDSPELAKKRAGVKIKAHSDDIVTSNDVGATVVVVNQSSSSTTGLACIEPSSSCGSSLNQALAIVANKWDREQRRQEQDTTRKLTLLKQRKVSAVLKVRLFFFAHWISNLESVKKNFHHPFMIDTITAVVG